MGERTEHAPGTFSWAELQTTDLEGAKRFYGELFGWEPEDVPVGDGQTYTMLRLGGKEVAAMYEQGEDQRQQGIPPNWLSYVTVDDLDARAARVDELGGSAIMPPFDVMEVGRMAVLQDPGAAVFAMWEPKTSIGATVVNDPGAMTWNELRTRDVDGATAFYGGLFGWKIEPTEGADGSYFTIRNGERLNGGVIPISEDWAPVPPHWAVYFTVPDADEAIARIEELGGRVQMAPIEVPAGRFAGVADPQGASFSLFEGETED